LTLVFDSALDAAALSNLATNDINSRFSFFTAASFGGTYTQVGTLANPAFTALTVSGSTVTLTLAAPLTTGHFAQISYTDPASDQATGVVQDQAGNDLASFANTPVYTNPVILGFAVSDAGNSNGANLGKAHEAVTVAVTFSESVTLSANSTFTVRVQIGSNASDGFDAILDTTGGAPSARATYTFSGTLPGTAGLSTNALQLTSLTVPAGASINSTAGNQLLTLSTYLLGSTAYTVDSSTPTAPALVLGSSVPGGATQAEATAAGGVVTVNAENGSTVRVTFTDSAATPYSVVKTVTGSGSALGVTLDSADLGSGSTSLQDGTIRVSATATDAAGNLSTAGSSSFLLDTVIAPTALTLGMGISGGATAAEATLSSGVVTVLAESGSTVLVTFTDSAATPHSVVKTVTGSGTALAVVLASSDLGNGPDKLQDGNISISATATDAAGNASTAGSSFTLDTAIAPPALALGTGVEGGATAAEALAASGVITVTAESGSTVLVTFTDSAATPHSVFKTITGTGSALGVTLGNSDLGTGATRLLDGTIRVTATATDLAGNASTAGSSSFMLDTVLATPTLALGTGVPGGATAMEATASTGVVSVTAESGSTVLVTFTDSAATPYSFIKTVTGTGAAIAVTLASSDLGSGAASLQDGTIRVTATATDLAGNASTAGSSFTLDTRTPDAPTLALGTGVEGGATAAEALAASGVITVTAESGSTVLVTFSDSAVTPRSFVKTITGTGVAVGITLASSDLGTGATRLLDGTIHVSALATDAAGNASTTASSSFTLDTSIAATTLALGSGVSGAVSLAKATQASGVVTVLAESGSTVLVTFGNTASPAHSLVKTLTGTGTAQAVTLAATDLGTDTSQIRDGTIRVSATATDAAGNTNTSATSSFSLDITAPPAPTLALGAGVSDGATAAEATAVGGVVTVRAENGSTVRVTFTDTSSPAHSLVKTVIGTGAAQPVMLTISDLGADSNQLQNGNITVTAVATDAAGNASPLNSDSFTLNAILPARPTLTLGEGVSGGATEAEALAATGVITVLAESGSTVRVTFTDTASPTHSLVKTLTGTGTALAVTLDAADLGSGTSQLQDGSISVLAAVTNAEGNTSTVGSNFLLDRVPPMPPTYPLGAGVSGGATAAEATASNGVLIVTAQNGNRLQVVLTGPNGSVTKNMSGEETEYPGLLGTPGATFDIIRRLDGISYVVSGYSRTTFLTFPDIDTLLREAAITFFFSPLQIDNIRAIPSPGSVQLTSTDLSTLGEGTITLTATTIDAAGNTSTATTGSFTLDTLRPAQPTLALVTGIADGARQEEATASTGVVTVHAESGSSVVITFTDSAQHHVVKTLRSEGSSQPVTLNTSDLGAANNQLLSGSINVSAVATDAAGNASSAGTARFDLFANPIVLGTGVANGASSAEATASSGVVVLAVASGSSALVTFTDSAMHSLVRNLTGTGAVVPVTLAASDLGTNTGQLQDGAIRVSATVTVPDPASNINYSGTASFTLDTVAPATPILTAPANSNPLPLVAGWVRKIDRQFDVTKNVNGTYSIFINDSVVQGGENLSFDALRFKLANDSGYPFDTLVIGWIGESAPPDAQRARPLIEALPLPGSTPPTLQAEAGSTVLVTFTDTLNQSLIKTITGKGEASASAVPINLSASDLGTDVGDLQQGLITVSLLATDAAGNESSRVASSFILDTVAPTASVANQTGLKLVSSSHQYARLPSNAVAVPGTNSASQLTLEAWVFASGTPSDGTRLFDLASANNTYNIVLGFTSTGKLYFEAFGGMSGSTSLGQTLAPSAFPANSWHHVAVSVESGNAITLYVDGASVVSGTLSGAVPITTRGSSYVGHSNASSTLDFNGSIREVLIFGYGKSSAAIREHMSGNFQTSWTDLIGYYPFTSSSTASGKLQVTDATLIGNPLPFVTNLDLTFSNDDGIAMGDYIVTSGATAQTITAKLQDTLEIGDKVWGSLDSGSTWTDLSSSTSGTTITWTNATLRPGDNNLQLVVKDEAGNFGPLLIQPYTVLGG
ncbi:MAG: LamG domain-containing protein, partial [Rhodoferax sp.]|nr:LamG domain-containing protein [Rhodoferax sp.]